MTGSDMTTLLLINPNTTISITDLVLKHAKRFASKGTTLRAATGAFGPRYLTQRSSEEEGSDHDYYNDLQRELQPLQPLKRNETTV